MTLLSLRTRTFAQARDRTGSGWKAISDIVTAVSANKKLAAIQSLDSISPNQYCLETVQNLTVNAASLRV
ncbi:hypothetical protein CEXT_206191 [Caerostris extrusa]|uniref:Uncharacterized protein n=1 Tax=Caerostris extrusa TaxID=172846 RepID=A0AAV4P1F8_CAEEX|nr:hypothetical protein CEXT_206191 [Caerostris extrusa]